MLKVGDVCIYKECNNIKPISNILGEKVRVLLRRGNGNFNIVVLSNGSVHANIYPGELYQTTPKRNHLPEWL